MRRETEERINARTRSEWEHLIHEWVHNERDRYLLTRWLLDGLSQKELCNELTAQGKRLELDQMKRRLYKAQAQLFKHA